MKMGWSFLLLVLCIFTQACSTATLATHNPELYWIGRASERTESEIEIKLTFVSGENDKSDALGYLTLHYPNKKNCKKREMCENGVSTSYELEGKRKGDSITLFNTQNKDGIPKRVIIVRFKDPRNEFLDVELEMVQMSPYTNITLHKSILLLTKDRQKVAFQ